MGDLSFEMVQKQFACREYAYLKIVGQTAQGSR
jgi:hypothetical protein